MTKEIVEGEANESAPDTTTSPQTEEPHMHSALLDESVSLNRRVLMLAWPVMVENLLQTMLGIVDTAMISRLGSDAIAGVGSAIQMVFLINSLFSAISVGTTVLVARYIGARKPEDASHVLKQSILLSFIMSTLVAIIGGLFADPIIGFLGLDAQARAYGAEYWRIICITSLVLILMFMLGGALRGAGDTRTPMTVTAIINVVNVGAAYVLIFGAFGIPVLGVTGSAWGATIARTVGALMMLGLLFGNKTLRKILRRPPLPITLRSRKNWNFDLGLTRRIMAIGVPSMIEQFLTSFGSLTFSLIVIHMGTVVYATQRITFNALSLSFLPGFAFSIAATALVGQFLGAKQPEQAQKAAWVAVRSAFIWMTGMGLLFFFAGEWLLAPFIPPGPDGPAIRDLGIQALKVIAIAQPIQAMGFVLAGALRGAGDTRYPMWITGVDMWLVRIPLAYLIGVILGFGLPGVYTGIIFGSFWRSVMNFWRWERGRWKEIDV